MVTPLAEWATLGPDPTALPAAHYPDLPYEDLAAALRSAVAGGDPAEVGRILDGSGSRILAAGHLLAVEEAVGALPPAALTPARLTLLANARQVRGDAEGALAICRQAAETSGGTATPRGAAGPTPSTDAVPDQRPADGGPGRGPEAPVDGGPGRGPVAPVGSGPSQEPAAPAAPVGSGPGRGPVAPVDGGRPMPAAVAWRMGLVSYQAGEPGAALAAYARGRLDREDTLDEALLLAWSATACWMLGDRAGCDRFAGRARAAAARCGDGAALAAAHSALAMAAKLAGDRSGNGRHWALALDAAERAGDLLQVVRIRANRGSHFLEEGCPAEAVIELDHAARLAERIGFVVAVGLCCSNLGLCLLQLGQFGDAVAAFERSKAAFQSIGSRMIAYALVGLGDAYRERGDLALARAAYEEAIATGEATDSQAWVPAVTGLARVLAAHDLPAAWTLARQALRDAGDRQPAVELTVGWLHLQDGSATEAQALARRVAAAAGPRRDRATLAEALELEALCQWSARPEPGQPDDRARWLLTEARSVWREIGHPVGAFRVRYALGRLFGSAAPADSSGEAAGEADAAAAELAGLGVRVPGPHGAGLLAAVYRCAPPRVAVRVLGRFEINRGGEPVADTEWQSRKARELLKILLARRGRAIPRGRLVELLWPDEHEPDVLANRLSVALATVRRVLDPDRTHPAGHYVVTEDGSVTLALNRLDVDVETFLRDAINGLRARSAGTSVAGALLRRAAATYRGDVLEEDVYADWAHALREEARAAHLAVLRAQAEDAGAAGDTDQAVLVLIRLLDHDPYDEPAHLAMVSVLAAAGRYGDARRAHCGYTARMAEIGVEPAAMPAPAPRRGAAARRGAADGRWNADRDAGGGDPPESPPPTGPAPAGSTTGQPVQPW
ncbi:MAG: hypothetical protein V7637_583 [Mycobacteriales bacterium]|jgi:DNA-binding SARP family transcriptional activator